MGYGWLDDGEIIAPYPVQPKETWLFGSPYKNGYSLGYNYLSRQYEKRNLKGGAKDEKYWRIQRGN